MWTRHEIGLDRTYLAYFLFSSRFKRLQMTPYHDKGIYCQKVADTTLGKKNADGLY